MKKVLLYVLGFLLIFVIAFAYQISVYAVDYSGGYALPSNAPAVPVVNDYPYYVVHYYAPSGYYNITYFQDTSFYIDDNVNGGYSLCRSVTSNYTYTQLYLNGSNWSYVWNHTNLSTERFPLTYLISCNFDIKDELGNVVIKDPTFVYEYSGIENGTTYGEFPQVTITTNPNIYHYARIFKKPVSNEIGKQAPFKILSNSDTHGTTTFSNQQLPNGEYVLEIGIQPSCLTDQQNDDFEEWSTVDGGFWIFGSRVRNCDLFNDAILQNFQNVYYLIKFTVTNTNPLVKFYLSTSDGGYQDQVDTATITPGKWRPVINVDVSNTNDSFKITFNDKELNTWVGAYSNHNIQGYTPFLKPGENKVCLYNTTQNKLFKTLTINATQDQIDRVQSETPIDSIHDNLNGSDYKNTVGSQKPQPPNSVNPVDWIVYLIDLISYYAGQLISSLSNAFNSLSSIGPLFQKIFGFFPPELNALLIIAVGIGIILLFLRR